MSQRLDPKSQVADDQVAHLLKPPGGCWLRSGMLLLFLVVILGFLAAALIRYPDRLPATVVLQRAYPPQVVTVQQQGVLAAFFVDSNAVINEGAYLGRLQSRAKWEEVSALLDWTYGKTTTLPEGLNFLGSLQARYDALGRHGADLAFFERNNGISSQLQQLRQDLKQYANLDSSFRQQVAIQTEESALAEKTAIRDQELQEQGLISQEELEARNQARLWQAKQQAVLEQEQARSALGANKARREIAQLGQAQRERLFELQQAILRAEDGLKEAVRNWEEQHIIIAPVSGRFHINPGRFEGASLNVGTILGEVIPETGPQTIIARCRAGVSGIGKLKVGDPIHIRLDAYPVREFGMIRDTVDHISLRPIYNDNGELAYEVLATLPSNLVTTYGTTLAFRQNMPGTADLITEDRSLLQRITDRIFALNYNR